MSVVLSQNSKITFTVVIFIISVAVGWGVMLANQSNMQKDIEDIKEDFAAERSEKNEQLVRLEIKLDRLFEQKLTNAQ